MDEKTVYLIDEIRRSSTLPEPPPLPVMPDLNGLSVLQKIQQIQRFINTFQYNFTGKPFVKMQKSRGMIHISSCAQEIIRIALPIQCVEAVFLGCFLTSTIPTIDRVPISFKSKCGDNIHRHIVLGIRHNGIWGAIGISRRPTLMDKEVKYDSLSSLILDYQKSYADCYHHLLAVYVGLPFSHDVFSDTPIKWRAIRVNARRKYRDRMIEELNTYTTNMTKWAEYFARERKLPSFDNRKPRLPHFHTKANTAVAGKLRVSTAKSVKNAAVRHAYMSSNDDK